MYKERIVSNVFFSLGQFHHGQFTFRCRRGDPQKNGEDGWATFCHDSVAVRDPAADRRRHLAHIPP
jgi:hypothetical protein